MLEDEGECLSSRERKGSRARCIWLTHGAQAAVARTLSDLLDGHGTIAAIDRWMPVGPKQPAEALIGRSPTFLTEAQRAELASWWLAVRPATAKLPTWDIVSTATIGGRSGLLLVEAKAHPRELANEEGPKRLRADHSSGSGRNHRRIAQCIDGVCADLHTRTTWPWKLSIDARYQMANRFAWGWKIASLGVPVALVYLGFLNATEMPGVFATVQAWTQAVHHHGVGRVPPQAWDRRIDVGGTPFVPLIQSRTVPLPRGWA